MPLPVVVATIARLAAAPDTGATCYALDAGPWSRPAFVFRVPARVRLGLERAPVGMVLAPDLDRRDERVAPGFPRWLRVDQDSLRLEWSNGFTGVTLVARVRSGVLQGRAETWSDELGSPQAVAVVTGRRVACSGPPAS